MRIVCLAWGSLVWNPGVLPVLGEWRPDGPWLPIEFARVGDKRELATALCPGAHLSPVHWARLDVDDIVVARRLLMSREEIDPDRVDGVGFVVLNQPPTRLLAAADISSWGRTRDDIDAVIWTALPPRYDATEGRIPSPREAAEYLLSLHGHDRWHAEDYVRRTPKEIQTPNREALERAIAS